MLKFPNHDYFYNKKTHIPKKITEQKDEKFISEKDLEDLIGEVRGFCNSGKMQSFIAQAKKEILKGVSLKGDEMVRRDYDGVSSIDYVIEKMIGEFLSDDKINF